MAVNRPRIDDGESGGRLMEIPFVSAKVGKGYRDEGESGGDRRAWWEVRSQRKPNTTSRTLGTQTEWQRKPKRTEGICVFM